MQIKKWILAIAVIAAMAFAGYLTRPLEIAPQPATFSCLDTTAGSREQLQTSSDFNIYGLGFTYAAHIEETASNYDPDIPPPVFRKLRRSLLIEGGAVPLPSSAALFAAADSVEPGLSKILQQDFPDLKPQLDYETEMAFVLLEDIPAAQLRNLEYVPKLAFTIANDLTSRSVGVLGEGRSNRHEYWSAGKSFPSFAPIHSQLWIPDQHIRNGIPCVTIETHVNGERRQQQTTRDLIYTPLEMLQYIQQHFPDRQLRKGDIVLTGTPAGVSMTVPRWQARIADMIGIDRFSKLKVVNKKEVFLTEGDEVIVSGNSLGQVAIKIVQEQGRQ